MWVVAEDAATKAQWLHWIPLAMSMPDQAAERERQRIAALGHCRWCGQPMPDGGARHCATPSPLCCPLCACPS